MRALFLGGWYTEKNGEELLDNAGSASSKLSAEYRFLKENTTDIQVIPEGALVAVGMSRLWYKAGFRPGFRHVRGEKFSFYDLLLEEKKKDLRRCDILVARDEPGILAKTKDNFVIPVLDGTFDAAVVNELVVDSQMEVTVEPKIPVLDVGTKSMEFSGSAKSSKSAEMKLKEKIGIEPKAPEVVVIDDGVEKGQRKKSIGVKKFGGMKMDPAEFRKNFLSKRKFGSPDVAISKSLAEPSVSAEPSSKRRVVIKPFTAPEVSTVGDVTDAGGVSSEKSPAHVVGSFHEKTEDSINRGKNSFVGGGVEADQPQKDTNVCVSELPRFDMGSSGVDDPFVPEWDLRKGSRLVYPAICKNWLMSVLPPAEVTSVQHTDSGVLHDNIATALTSLVVNVPEICRREAYYEEKFGALLLERDNLKAENLRLKVASESSERFQRERDDFKNKYDEMVVKFAEEVSDKATVRSELVKVKDSLIKESEARLVDVTKKQNIIDNKVALVKRLRAELEEKVSGLSECEKKLDNAQREAESLKETVARLRDDKEWILSRGLVYALEMFHSSTEYRNKLEDLATAGDVVGIQDGLRIGFALGRDGGNIESHPMYASDAEEKLVDAYQALSDVEPSVLSDIAKHARDEDASLLKTFFRGGEGTSSASPSEKEADGE